jgi:hypothetical protein
MIMPPSTTAAKGRCVRGGVRSRPLVDTMVITRLCFRPDHGTLVLSGNERRTMECPSCTTAVHDVLINDDRACEACGHRWTPDEADALV